MTISPEIHLKNLKYCTHLEFYTEEAEVFTAPENQSLMTMVKVIEHMQKFRGEYTPQYKKIENWMKEAQGRLLKLPPETREVAAKIELKGFKGALQKVIQEAETALRELHPHRKSF